MISFLLLIATSLGHAATQYRCSIEITENVPLRKVFLKSNEACPACGDPKTEIAEAKMDKDQTQDWNPSLRQSKEKEAGPLKRASYKSGNSSIYLDSRSLKHKALRFQMNLSCDRTEKCKATLKDAKSGTLQLGPIASADQRRQGNELAVTVTALASGGFGLSVGIQKTKSALSAANDKDGTGPLGLLSEMKIYGEEERFIMESVLTESLAVVDQEVLTLNTVSAKTRCQIADDE